MTYFPEIPYVFNVTTPAGTVRLTFPATQWDVAATPEVSGPGEAMLKGYIDDWGIGFHGQLFTLESVTPMDLEHALLMNRTTRFDPRIFGFEMLGDAPAENPDPEDDSRWAEDGDAEVEDDDA